MTESHLAVRTFVLILATLAMPLIQALATIERLALFTLTWVVNYIVADTADERFFKRLAESHIRSEGHFSKSCQVFDFLFLEHCVYLIIHGCVISECMSFFDILGSF